MKTFGDCNNRGFHNAVAKEAKDQLLTRGGAFVGFPVETPT